MIHTTKFSDIPDLAKLKAMFLDLENVLEYDGKTWRYKTNQTALRFDKYIHEKTKSFVLSLNPKNSILTGKSIKELLEPHAQRKFLLRSDITHYFESIKYSPFIKKALSKSNFDTELAEKIEAFYFDKNHALRRGLRASAILSEIMGIAIDNTINKLIHTKYYPSITYTRYYDDLLLSGDDKQTLRAIEITLRTALLVELGLTINDKKSKITLTENSKVLGMRFHSRHVTATKQFKRIVRARAHNFDSLYSKMTRNDWIDHSILYDKKKDVGSVIGSYWHLVNNSQYDTTFEESQIEHYMGILAELQSALDDLHADPNIFYEG